MLQESYVDAISGFIPSDNNLIIYYDLYRSQISTDSAIKIAHYNHMEFTCAQINHSHHKNLSYHHRHRLYDFNL